MEFIDKNRGKRWAHPILKSFLDRCRIHSSYPKDLYDAMKSDIDPDAGVNPDRETTYRRLLAGILSESSEGEGLPSGVGHCCYCMRTINASDSHSTLEHVIPNKIKSLAEYRTYFSVASRLESDEHVMVYRDVFLNRHKGTCPPFPHNVAYENLVASCDGLFPNVDEVGGQHICCNNYRGDRAIPPFLFMENIHREFIYKSQSGNVIWKGNPNISSREEKRIVDEVLNLNCDHLRMVRMIWSFLAENRMDCHLTAGERRWVIDSLLQRCHEKDKELINNFRSENYWALLDEYRYFNDKSKFS